MTTRRFQMFTESLPEYTSNKLNLLTMKCLLEPLDAHHVLCEFEGLAFGLDGELAAQSNNTLISADLFKPLHYQSVNLILTHSHSAASPDL